NCLRAGSYGGTTLDGVMLTTHQASLPLGHHVLTEAWDNCLTDPDDTVPDNGAYMVEYDFPQTWGVGTLTIHVSRYYYNGTVHADVVANEVNGNRSDDIVITIEEDFSVGDMKTGSEKSISVDRRYTNDKLKVDDTYVDLDASLIAYDDDGSAGPIGVRQGDYFHLHQNFSEGDNGDPEYVSHDVMVVGMDSYVLAALAPSGSPQGWSFQ